MIVGENPLCDEENCPEEEEDNGDDYEEDYEVEALPGFPLVIPGSGGGVSLVGEGGREVFWRKPHAG